MEFKTCEEYVLAELDNAQRELDVFKIESERAMLALAKENEVLKRVIEILNPSIESTYDGRFSISTEFLWTNHSEETTAKFNELVKLLNLKYPE